MRFFFVTSTLSALALWGCDNDQGISGGYDENEGIFVDNDGSNDDMSGDDGSNSVGSFDSHPGAGNGAISGEFPFEGDLGGEDGGMEGEDGEDGGVGDVAPMGRLQRVFAMTNSAQRNEIIALRPSWDGVRPVAGHPTGGDGLGLAELPDLAVMDGIDPLVSEGSLHQVGRHLLAVNAGSGSVSSFHVGPGGGLSLIDVEPINGYPTTIASQGNVVFVGVSPGPDGESGIVMMELDEDGSLDPVGRVLRLSGTDSHPSRVLVAGGGRFLVATEVMSDVINVWPLSSDGRPGRRYENTSEGTGPFGAAAFGGEYLFVTEAAPMMEGEGSISTYRFEEDGSLTPVTSMLGNGQSATCWVQITPDGRFAFVTNTESGTISSYVLSEDGSAKLADSVADMPGMGPIDLSLDGTGRRLYVLLGEGGDIATYSVTTSGRLKLLGVTDTDALPQYGTQGILAWRDLGRRPDITEEEMPDDSFEMP